MKARGASFLVLLLALCLGSIGHAVEPFKPGERVAFLGDSITHYGTWWPSIWCAYVERHPENPPLLFNAGFSGDRADRALARLERDVFALNPDTVCVLFGMNDVPSPNESALKNYLTSMDHLLKQLTEGGLRCIVITPSPYDQTMVNPKARKPDPGRNDGLAQAAQIAIELAQKYSCETVDFHGPMTRLNLERQKKDPAASIIGPDRMHPGDEGAQIMARRFLEAQGVGTDALTRTDTFTDVWAHVQMERHRRNILWLIDNTLKPRGIDPEDIKASKSYLAEQYRPSSGADRERVRSYLEWRGREAELERYLQANPLRQQERRTVEEHGNGERGYSFPCRRRLYRRATKTQP